MLLTETPPTRAETAVEPPRDLRTELQASRAETDRLFEIVGDNDLYLRPLPQRHRLIFYLGHLEAFDWNQIGRGTLGEGSVHETFDRLFERGIDPEPGQLPSDQPSDWPSVQEARDYLHSVRRSVDARWARITPEIQQTVVEHRWMHAETLAYLLHNLAPEQKRPPVNYRFSNERSREVRHGFIDIPEGFATLGRERGTGFGWDNEFPSVSSEVPAFAISRYKVTNGDYLEFVKEGHDAPHFWERRDRDWYFRGMFETYPLPLDAPVYVTHDQAAAYARSRGATLPSESQYHRAAFGTPNGGERNAPWGNSPAESDRHGNFDFRYWDPVPVTSSPEGASAFGVEQLIGNGWEWTSTLFGPFPGFKSESNYPGYSADFFDDRHYVLKGASPRTAAILTRRSLRNWFRPDYPYLYSTFRLVEN